MTTYALRTASPAKTKAEAVVVGVVPGPALAPGAEDVADAYGRKLDGLLATMSITGRAGEVAKVPTGGVIGSPLLVLVGLGDADDTQAVRRAAGNAARAASSAASIALALPADTPELARAVVEGFRLGGYAFTAYKSGAGAPLPAEVVVLTPAARRKEIAAAVAEAQVIADATYAMRDWVNTPPVDLTPPAFATSIGDAVKAANKGLAKGASRLKIDVYDETRLTELGCGGTLAVGAGSDAPPRIVELRYRPDGAVAHLAIVGKGITFDSGGLTIKPGSGMSTMKEDMAGAAAAIQATIAIARLGLPVQVTTVAGLAENMVGGASFRPGDVVTVYGGTTVEVTNTDAEGRMVLADCLGLAAERKPDLLVDIATLTGHMMQALGDRMAGVMGDDTSVATVLAAAAAAGEDAWPMPIPEFMTERINGSRIADLAQHDWVRWGGGLMAAAFLREFTHGLPWAHLDIAGPTFNKAGATGHLAPGATGYGLATLVEIARGLTAPAASAPA